MVPVSHLFDINSQDQKGMTSLMKATMNNHVRIVSTLLEFGANPRLSNLKGETALHMACMNENFAICQQLLVAMCDINAKDPQGRTPLMYAVRFNKKVDIVQLLIQKGACLATVDN